MKFILCLMRNRLGEYVVSEEGGRLVASVLFAITFMATFCNYGIAQKLLDSEWVTIQSYNFPDRYIRHRNYLGELTTVKSNLDTLDSTFKVVKGLAGRGTVSFESKNYPGYYLRHHNFRIKLHKLDGSDLFRQDASFIRKTGLAIGLWNVPIDESLTSYESVNYPGFYIRHRADNNAEEASKVFHLYIEKYVRSDSIDPSHPKDAEARFRRDCTFKLKSRLFPPPKLN